MMRTLLIVDDVKSNRDILIHMLGGDYRILEAENGREALDCMAAAHQDISAVLLDLSMPVLDGYGVLARMQEDEALRQLPVIVATGRTDADSEERALTLGAKDYISKPYKSAIIKQRIRNTINLRETAAAVNTLQRDRLTGVWNRETFFQKAALEIAQQPAGHFILGCVDIDGFKVINDQYGSETGDRILRSLADALRESCGTHGGLCGRIFADRFIALYSRGLEDSGLIGPQVLEERLRVDAGMPLKLSVGRYIVADKSLSVSAMYDRAAIAQRTIKGRYDAHVAVYDERMRDQIVREQQIVNEMNAALAERQFEVWFQPQYNHATGALIGAEALVRWRHPVKGLVPPGDFIPVFERSGFVYALDKFVWEETCRHLRKWTDEGRDPLPVSVNISRYDIFRPDLIAVLTGLPAKYGIPVELLRLEITESAFARSTEQIVATVRQLVGLGFTVEIDDFGSGYSSLNTLKDVPAQVVKIDMRFLEADGGSGRGGNILESVVRMTKWLGMSVIAEGVETREQADYLASVGCSYVQGYLYARPMPAPDYEAHCRGAGKEERLLTMEAVAHLDNNAFWNPASMDTLIFNSYVGAACIFEYSQGDIELLRVNRKFTALIGGGALSTEDTLKLDWIASLAPESLARVRDVLRRSAESGEEYAGEYVFLNIPGGPPRSFLRATMRVIASAGRRLLVYCTCENITAQREAEQAARRTAAQLQTMLDDMPGGFVRMRLDEDGHIRPVFFNCGFRQLTGMDQNALMALYADDAMAGVHPDDAGIVRDAVERMLRDGEARSARYRLRHGDGGHIWLMFFGRVTKDAAGVRFLNVYYMDASGQAREAERQRELLDNLPGGAGLYEYQNGALSVVHLNRSYWALVGREPKDYAGLLPLDAVHPDDMAVVSRELAAAIEQRRDMVCGIRLRHEAGGYLPVQLVGRIVPAEDGRYTIYTIFTPVTDGRASYQQMLPALLSAMAEATTDLTFAKDTHLRYLSASRAFANMAGLPNAEDVIGKTDYDLFDRALADKYRRDDEALLQGGGAIVDAVEAIPSPDGTPRYSSTSKYLLRDGSGEVIGLYGVGRDVTRSVTQDSQLGLVNDSLPGGLAAYVCTPGDFSPEHIRITYFNDGFCRLFGFTREEYERRAAADPASMLFEEDRPLLAGQWRRLMEHGTPIDCLYRVHVNGGGYKWISHRAAAADRQSGRVVVNAILQDVTDQRELIEQLRIGEEENRLAVRLGGNVVCRFLIAERTLTLSPEAAAAHGLPQTVSGIPHEPIRLGMIAPESEEAYIGFFESIIGGSKAAEATFRQRYLDGWRWLEAKSATVFSDGGAPVKAVISFFDVTERLERERIYRKWQQSLEDRPPESYMLFRCNLNNDASYVVADGTLLPFDFAAAGRDFNERAKAYTRLCVHPDDRERYAAFANADAMLAGYYRGRRSDTLEYRETLPDGDFRWLRLTVDLVESPNSSEIEAHLFYEDIDAAKRAALQTKERSETDPLTGILNRAAFAARVGEIAASSAPEARHALLLLDLDGFKQVNDVFGHAAGDRTLTDIADGLRPMVRRSDLAARLGGDEFIVLLRDISCDAAAAAKAEQICALARRSLSLEVQVSGSVGIALAPQDGADFETLYKKADAALYHVKGSGKDGYAFYRDDMADEHLRPEADAAPPQRTEKRRRMLIVDDSELDYLLLSNVFAEDFIVETARDGESALIRLRHYGSAISVVLLDLLMPGMDGFAVLDRLRAVPETQDIPVLIVSGDESREACLRAIRMGATDFITKPVDPALLRIRVNSAVSRAENERLRAKNSLLEARHEAHLRFEGALENAGVTFVEYDPQRSAFRYYPTVPQYLAGTYDSRALWDILREDGAADAAAAEALRALILGGDEAGAGVLVRLGTPQGAAHRFRVTVHGQAGGQRLITLCDLDLVPC